MTDKRGMDNAHKASEKQKKDGRAGRFEALQKELWARLGPTNTLILLAAGIGMLAGLLSVLLKNGVGWLRSLPESTGEVGSSQLLFFLPILGLVLTHLLVRKGFGGRHPGPGIPATLHALSRMRARLSRMSMVSSATTAMLTVGFEAALGRRLSPSKAVRPLRPRLPSGSDRLPAQARAHRLRGHHAGRHVQGAAGGDCVRRRGDHDRPHDHGFVPLLIASLSALLTATLFIDPKSHGPAPYRLGRNGLGTSCHGALRPRPSGSARSTASPATSSSASTSRRPHPGGRIRHRRCPRGLPLRRRLRADQRPPAQPLRWTRPEGRGHDPRYSQPLAAGRGHPVGLQTRANRSRSVPVASAASSPPHWSAERFGVFSSPPTSCSRAGTIGGHCARRHGRADGGHPSALTAIFLVAEASGGYDRSFR